MRNRSVGPFRPFFRRTQLQPKNLLHHPSSLPHHPSSSLFQRVFHHRRLYTTIKVIPPAPTALRESPTPIACFGGLWSTAADDYETNGIVSRLSSLGYTVGVIDITIPLNDKDVPLDDIIDNMRKTLTKAFGHSSPLALTQSYTSVLVQKYLESHPLSGCVMVSPLPPACGYIIERWLEQNNIGGKGKETLVQNIDQRTKPSSSSSSKGNTSRLSGESIVLDTDTIHMLLRTMNPYPKIGTMNQEKDTLYTQAQLLQRFAKEPVMLEPQPVPLLVTTSLPEENSVSSPLWLTVDDIERTIEYHELDNDNIIEIDEKDILPILFPASSAKNKLGSSSLSSTEKDSLVRTLGLSSITNDTFIQTTVWKNIEKWIDRRY